jgi:hypothetical protein
MGRAAVPVLQASSRDASAPNELAAPTPVHGRSTSLLEDSGFQKLMYAPLAMLCTKGEGRLPRHLGTTAVSMPVQDGGLGEKVPSSTYCAVHGIVCRVWGGGRGRQEGEGSGSLLVQETQA